MRISDLHEYRVLPPQPQLGPLPLSGNPIGMISANGIVFFVLRVIHETEIAYGAVLRDDPNEITCTLGFEIMSEGNALIARNAWTHPEFRKMGLASELMHFVNKLDSDRGKQPILSDKEMSPDGEALWNSLIKSGKFSAKIHDLATHLTYEIGDCVEPKHDNASDHLWNGTSGQRYFYLLETNLFKWFDATGQEHLCEGAGPSGHLPKTMLIPYAYFSAGDD